MARIDDLIKQKKAELGPVTTVEKERAEMDEEGARNEDAKLSREIQGQFRQSTGGVGRILDERRESRKG